MTTLTRLGQTARRNLFWLFGYALTAAAVLAAIQSTLAALVFVAVFLSLCALRLPYVAVVVALAVGTLGPSYIYTHVSPIPFDISGVVGVAVVLIAAAVGALASGTVSTARQARWRGPALILLTVWMTTAFFSATGGAKSRLAFALGVTFVDIAAAGALLFVASSRQGRNWALLGMCAAGSVTASVGVVELITGHNAFLQIGLAMGTAEKWAEVPQRFGLTRASGAFGHPLLMATFMGLCILSTLELARERRLPDLVAVSLILLQFVGQFATLSRIPILATLAVVALWSLTTRSMRASLRVALVLALCVATLVGLTQVGVGTTRVWTLFQTSGTETGRSEQYRLDLVKVFASRLGQVGFFGTSDPESSRILPSNFTSIDNEPIFVSITRGYIGFATLTAFVCGPALAALLDRRRRLANKPLPVFGALYLLATGANVAFFGLLLPYVFIFVSLMWSSLNNDLGSHSSRVPEQRHMSSRETSFHV